MKRRHFLGTGIGLSAGLAFRPLSSLATEQTETDNRMKIKILATNWGDADPIEIFCKKIRGFGYDGLEIWYPSDDADRERLLKATAENGLEFGFLVGGWQQDFNEHYDHFEKSLTAAVQLKPLYINCHSGRDFFTFEQNSRFIDLTTRLEKESGVPIHHETHRSRICYSGPVTRRLLEAKSDMTLTLDISHWCNVHESMLDDQPETVALALDRTRHIHLRIGHPEGPQVNDPRAPEWQEIVEKHLGWWDKVVELRRAAGAPYMTFLTEFGPADYMPTIPYTRQPLANQWDINRHMLQLIRSRYT